MAVLVDDGERSFDVDVQLLPPGIREGTVLRVPVREAQSLEWRSAIVDEEEFARRAKEAARILTELKKRDPGGDVRL